MLGQNGLIKLLESYRKDGMLPQFLLIEGPKGSGKKMLIKELWKDAIFMQDCKVDTVRELNKLVRKQSKKVFVFADADDMSTAAKSALLKIAEEIPNDNIIIITVEVKESMPDTIRSRAFRVLMDRYLPEELERFYYDTAENATAEDAEIIKDVCLTPGEVLLLVQQGVQDLYSYVQLVLDNIAEVSGANAFKVASKVSLKDSQKGYDLQLFWKLFIRSCAYKEEFTVQKKADGIAITTYVLNDLHNIRGINKQMLMDKWIIDIREAWCEK